MKRSFSILILILSTAMLLAACGGGGGGGGTNPVPTYTVTYNGNGNTGGSVPVDTTNYQQGQTVTVLGNTGNLVKTGHIFAGWNTQASGSGTTYTQSQTFAIGTANVTLYANWTANPTYTVTYNGNGNTGGSVPVDTTNYQQGQTVTVLGNTGNLVMAGYSFTGWNTQASGSGTTYTQSQTFAMGTANVTLYANWTANPTYTVTYNGNGNTGGSVPVDTTNYQQGQTVTVLGNTGNLVMPGYSFTGWNTQASGSGTTYTQSQTFAMGSTNITLYAKWAIAPVCNASGNQYGVRLIKVIDGYIVAWQDERRVYRDIYAQKFDVDGNMKWANNGRVIAAGNDGEASNNLLYNSQSLTGIVSDTQGGAIVLWTEDYSCSSGPCGNGWITRVSSTGNVQWGAPPTTGVTIQGTDTAVPLNQPSQHVHADAVAPDGEGGAFVIQDYDAVGSWNVFRLDPNGALRSITSTVIGQRGASQMIYGGNSNGKDYVSIAWWDVYSGGDFAINIEDPEVNYPASTDALYAPWLKSTLTSTPEVWSEPSVISDGAGGMIVAWEDARNGDYDVFAQKINANGSVQWTPNGLPIAVQTGDQRRPQVVSDGAGGAVIVWDDSRTSPTRIYAQHVGAGGTTTWAANGIPVSSINGVSPKVIRSEDGTVIVVWFDTDLNGGTPDYLRAQKINMAGTLLWPPDSRTPSGGTTGTVISEIYSADFDIASDGSSGLIAVWNLGGDIYMKRVMSDGSVR